MATATVLPHLDGTGTPFHSVSNAPVPHGTTDSGAAIRVSGDAEYVVIPNSGLAGWLLVDESTLPAGAIISSIQFNVRHQVTAGEIDLVLEWNPNDLSAQHSIAWDAPHADGKLTSAAYVTWTATAATNPITGVAWTRSDLFGTNGVTLSTAYVTAPEYDIDFISLTVTYTPAWWKLVLPFVTLYYTGAQPSTYTLPFDYFSNGVFYPSGTTFTWVTATAPTDKGWWLATGDAFAGAAYVVDSTDRPEAPRGFVEVTTFATGSANFYGGFPGVATGFQNKLVYAPGGYTVGTTSPTLRIYDGQFDRPIATLPNTTAGAVPKAIVSTLTANGVVYVATYDTGTDSTSWVGRVFSLDVENGQMTPVGLPLPTGHLPYALAWHAGQLWCGTHRQSSSVSGKIFRIHPTIDKDWTTDYDLATSTVANCGTLWSYGGKLYVGTTNAAAAFAKVLVRDTAGAYTTSTTASGGTATANNGFSAMTDFGGNLYAAFYNADTPAVAKIYKFDGSTWSTVYTGSGTTIVPYVGLFSDLTNMFALGGGVGVSAVLLKTANGTTWTDQSTFLSQGSPASAGLPAFGVVVH